MPAAGVPLAFPSAGLAFNVRAFEDGMAPSATNTMIIPGGYFLGDPGGPNDIGHVGGLGGSLDGVDVGSGAVHGWAVDTSLPAGGVGPVTVTLTVDGWLDVLSVLANEDRPDLPPAGVAPNAAHGFSSTLPTSALATLQHGNHSVSARVVGSPACTNRGCAVPGTKCFCSGQPCSC